MRKFFSILIIIIGLFFVRPGSFENQTNSLANWNFDNIVDNEVIDQTGNGLNGYTNAKIVSGYQGNGLEFDGHSSYVRIKNSDKFNFENGLYIKMWIYTYSFSGDGDSSGNPLIAKGQTGKVGIRAA